MHLWAKITDTLFARVQRRFNETIMKITNYSFGHIEVDGLAYSSDVIITPEGVQNGWWRKEGHLLQLEDIGGILQKRPDVLVVGRGESAKMRVDAAVWETLSKMGIELIAAPTEQACDEFNRFMEQGKKVVAALHLTC